MNDHDCWKCEYDWHVSPRSRKSRETVVCVLFDSGTQRQFSGVRITLLYSNDVTSQHADSWRITPQTSLPSVVNRAFSATQDTPVAQNAASLPICNIVFTVDQCLLRSQTTSRVKEGCGELLLVDSVYPEGSNNTVFEFDQPLTENTQSVSVSFTSSYLLHTFMTRGVSFHPSTDDYATVCRVVRILPVVPMSKRRTVSLPTELLLLVFENLCFPLTRRGWKKDVLSSAMVCRKWICALDLLLANFRSRDSQHGCPPEIVGFTNGLVARPSLGLAIKHLSARYLETHPSWDPFPSSTKGESQLEFLDKCQLRRSGRYRSRFGRALISILGVARNVRTLLIDPGICLVFAPDDLVDVLCGLGELEEFEATRCTLSIAQLLSCIAAWPSLKLLTIRNTIFPPGHCTLPLASPSCSLTELELVGIPIRDDEFIRITSTSGTTLERLTLNRISGLTNAGLAAALNAVCTSLTYLWLTSDALPLGPGEERALDATIARMTRMTSLNIESHLASERMVERRSEAFLHCTTPALPEVDVLLLIARPPQICGLLRIFDGEWPGWRMSVSDPIGLQACYVGDNI